MQNSGTTQWICGMNHPKYSCQCCAIACCMLFMEPSLALTGPQLDEA